MIGSVVPSVLNIYRFLCFDFLYAIYKYIIIYLNVCVIREGFGSDSNFVLI